MLRPMQTTNNDNEAGTPPDDMSWAGNGTGFVGDFNPGTLLSTEQQQAITDQLIEEQTTTRLGDADDLRSLFQSSPTFGSAYSDLNQIVTSIATNAGDNSFDARNKIWDQIQLPSSLLQNIPLEGGYRTGQLGAPYQYEVKSFNELVRYPYQLNARDLQTLTNKLVYAGFLDRNQMPVGVFNAADPTFDTAWRALIRNSIANGMSLSQTLDNAINSRLEAAKKQLTDSMPDQRAGMQGVALGLLGRELNDAELDEAMNLITARFSTTMTEEERFLTGQSGAPDTTMATQAIGSIAEEEIAIQREGAGYLGLAQFNPRKNYGLSPTQKQAFAGLQDNPFENTETGMTNE